MGKPVAHLQRSFLEQTEQIWGGRLDDPAQISSAHMVAKILQNCQVLLDIPTTELASYVESHPMLKMAFKQGAMHIGEDKLDITNISPIDAERVHKDLIFCNNVSYNFPASGILSFSFDDIRSNLIERSISDALIEKRPGVAIHNTSLKPLQVCSNAAIILDQYLFEPPERWMKHLLPILDNLLPKELFNMEYQLSMIINPNDNTVEPEFNDFREKLDKLRSYPITFNAYISHAFHDREILTNYHYIDSGHGFTLPPKRNTKIKIAFLINTQSSGGSQYYQLMHNRLSEAKKVIAEIIKDGRTKNAYGKQLVYGDWKIMNRLLKDIR